MPKYRVTVKGKNYVAMADLVRKHKLNIAGHSAKALARGAYRVHAFADARQIRLLERAGYTVRRHEDVDLAGKQRQKETSPQAQPAGAATTAPLVAAANQYLNVDDIESALQVSTRPPTDGFTSLIDLPHKTWEGRACHAVKIANGSGSNRPGIYFLGGVHAREWGSPDILFTPAYWAFVASTYFDPGDAPHSFRPDYILPQIVA